MLRGSLSAPTVTGARQGDEAYTRRMTAPEPVLVWFARPDTVLGGVDPAPPAILDEADLAHVQRFRFPRDREIATASRWLQRFALAQAVATPEAAAALRFAPDEHGRPWVRSPPALAAWHFSAANTHGLVACAVDLRGPIGLDVESVGRALAPELVTHCCTDEEQRDLAALPPASQPAAFHALWTRKEAYMKARGLGLALEPHRIGFAAPVDGRWRVLLEGSTTRAGDWEVIDLPAGGTHAAALCLPSAWSATPRVAWAEHRPPPLTGAPGMG